MVTKETLPHSEERKELDAYLSSHTISSTKEPLFSPLFYNHLNGAILRQSYFKKAVKLDVFLDYFGHCHYTVF